MKDNAVPPRPPQHTFAAPCISFSSITKTFGGIQALSGITFSINRGECHGLMGENGAGKSTLGKILAGIHRPDAGSMTMDGRSLVLHSPRDATRHGIGMVHQELAFCPDLSVAENLCMGRYPRQARWFVNHAALRKKARAMLNEIGVSIDVTQPMHNLSTGQEQLVQIATAVGSGARVLVFDEPTSSLSEKESRSLFELIERLKQRGVTMIYVSHRMPEVMRLCDRISVLRDGQYTGTLERKDATEDQVVRMMIGRSIAGYFPKHLETKPGPVKLQVHDLSSPGKFRGVSFNVRAGEIVGVAGLVGSGRSEVARAIFGLDPAAQGSVMLNERPLKLGRCQEAMRHGLGFVPEDRKRQGLVLMMSCRRNFSLVILDRLRRRGFLDHRREASEATSFFSRLRVKTPSIDKPVEALSGGNQQKVVIAKWLARSPGMLIVDEPTRGVDVGAKAEIHALLDELARQGSAVLLISSELPEVINLSTRVIVMRDGLLTGEVARPDATQEKLMMLMAGVKRVA